MAANAQTVEELQTQITSLQQQLVVLLQQLVQVLSSQLQSAVAPPPAASPTSAPTPAPAPAPVPTSTPTPEPVSLSLILLSPNGGEYLRVEDLYQIKWKATGIDRAGFIIYLENETPYAPSDEDLAGKVGTYKLVEIARGVDPTLEIYEWRPSFRLLSGTYYKIRILGGVSDDTSVFDYSDNYFSIGTAIIRP